MLRIWMLFLLLPRISLAQQDKYRVSLGPAVDVAAKIALGQNDPAISVFGTYGIQAFLLLEGSEEDDFSCLIKGGLRYDRLNYKIVDNHYLGIGLYSVTINPQAVLPVGLNYLKLTAGFGIDCLIRESSDFSLISRNAYGHFYTSVAGVSEAVMPGLRKFVPYATVGVYLHRLPFDKTRRLQLALSVSQPLVNRYVHTIALPDIDPGRQFYLTKYQPTQITIAVGYVLLGGKRKL